ncbi:hypothetical protein X797_011196 [Metarhizium robertsii]|uniref:Uncharacterized protein n=2 Tax=Metarhizium robertsii TaxID=568076 RepID=A0A0B2X7B2_METRA|nr:uncharacterized protein MAA_11564 [Metarhizium robertsii ARSEF 23]EXU95741.1 hypothetical protein X797_011196 [Metarhizium robertsii]KHO10803.1 hypothetical protein MAA_11564 [Metarhizium robertsii ARSEF 23]
MSSALVQENGEPQTIETSQGSMVVSSDLLMGSRAVADASLAAISYPNDEVNSSTSLEACLSSSTLTSPNVLRDGVVSVQAESQVVRYPEPNGVEYHAPSHYKDGENWAIDPQLCESGFLDYVQSQGELSIPTSQLSDNTQDMEYLPLDTRNCVGFPRPPPTSRQPTLLTPSGVLNDRSSSSETPSHDGSSSNIPSYMTPNAIRARNLILSCNLPRRSSKTSGHVRNVKRRVSVSEDFWPSKRQKLDSTCCNS